MISLIDFALPFILFCLIRYLADYSMHLSPLARRRNRTVLPAVPQHNEPETSSKRSGSTSDAHGESKQGPGGQEFFPSMDDVQKVRNLLRCLGPRASETMPDEIVDMIIDEAEYWPSVVTRLDTTPFGIQTDGDKECLRTPPLCFSFKEGSKKDEEANEKPDEENMPQILLHRGLYPCRKIVFDISSHDQGWGGGHGDSGTFRGSYTWFDVYAVPSKEKKRALEDKNFQQLVPAAKEDDTRPEPCAMKPFIPTSSKLQRNRTATNNSTKYHIVWHYKDNIPKDSAEAQRIEREEGRGKATLDGQFVRTMQIGDQLVIWIRARFPGWRNHVEDMSVRVFWAA